jgi:lysophospholipase L1-like esterase
MALISKGSLNRFPTMLIKPRRLALAFLLGLMFLQTAVAQDPARFQSEIDKFKADAVNYSAREGLVLFTGSSTIRMWTGLQEDFPGIPVLNRGFGGSHMSDLLFYADTLILRYRPAMILIYEDDNDLDSGKTPAQILESAGKLVDRIRKKLPGSVICFIAAKPSIARWSQKDRFLDFNRQLKEFTGLYQEVHYLDLWDRMLDAGGNPDPSIFLGDGLHMNRKGYEIWKSVVGSFLEKHLKAK